MTNYLNEKRSYAVIIAAVISTLIIMLVGMITGLVYSVREHNTVDGGNDTAGHLLTDSAYNLRRSMSALRLCNEAEPAESINGLALVYAVRAETALECHSEDWADSRSKEQFLNDIATVLYSYAPEETIEMSDMLYEYSDRFYGAVSNGTEFEYDGELIKQGGNDGEHGDKEIAQDDIDRAAELVETALDASRVEYVGAWNGHIEFYIESGAQTGYALVCGDKIIEYSFMRDDNGEYSDVDEAERIAIETAAACGYDKLSVKWSKAIGRSVSVVMCKDYDGALAGDDCATAVVAGGKTVAFSAGKCDSEHKNIPSVKKTEREAHRALRGETGEGRLVVRTMNGKERVCYEYTYDLDDGVHYVYVCAENGKQVEVK